MTTQVFDGHVCSNYQPHTIDDCKHNNSCLFEAVTIEFSDHKAQITFESNRTEVKRRDFINLFHDDEQTQAMSESFGRELAELWSKYKEGFNNRALEVIQKEYDKRFGQLK